MQVCLKGHMISQTLTESDIVENYCDKCGEKTISKCPICNTNIPGALRGTPNAFGDSMIFPTTNIPEFCKNCGSPFPWIKINLNSKNKTNKNQMETRIEKEKAISLIESKIVIFEKLKEDATFENRYSEEYNLAFHSAISIISELFGKEEGKQFDIQVGGILALYDDTIDPEKDIEEYRANLSRCITHLKIFKENVINFWPTNNSSLQEIDFKEQERNIDHKSIFIVHGKNEEMKHSVARLLSSIELKPIILHEQPNAGNTIIEKFEKHSNVKCAIVLLSADDEIITRGKEKLFRARQNVIFEMGFFIGKLGRKNVIAVLQTDKPVEKPSDYDGVLYIEFDDKESWRTKISKELKELNYDLDMNNL